MPKSSLSVPGAVVPAWVHARVQALPVSVLDYVQTAGADTQWLRCFLEALGEDVPPIPADAWSDLELVVWMHGIVPPRRYDLALAAAQAMGVHARRHGWEAVKQFLYGDSIAALPPYLAFGGMLSRLMAGANAVDAAAIKETSIVRRTWAALEHLFAGCDLSDLDRYVAAWEGFVFCGGLAPGDMPPPPVLFESKALQGGEVIAIQLGTEAALRAARQFHLWPMVATGQTIRILLDMGQPIMSRRPTLLFRPTLEGQWTTEGIWARRNPEFQVAARELDEVMARAPDVLRQVAREAAARRERYESPTGALYSDPQRATPAELAAVGCWFPEKDGDDALQRLRHAWDVGAHTTTI